MAVKSDKLGLLGLMAIVFGVITGGGFYNISQNMADGASMGASMIGWGITGFGMLFLVMCFKILSDREPQLNMGIYQYALLSGGKFVGFIVAWGYWLCAAMGNVAFAILLNDSIGYFFPVLLEHGWLSIALCSALIWMMYAIISIGISVASAINTIITIIKFGSIAFVILLFIIYFKSDILFSDVWGNIGKLGDVQHQVNGTILVTLWCFVGVESAVMLSARAKNSKNIGVATVVGFVVALGVYAIVTMLSYGIMGQAEIAALKDPSIGYLLESVVGKWGVVFIAICTILAVLGGSIAWSLVCIQVPLTASKLGLFPRVFSKENTRRIPTVSLLVSTIIMQIFIFIAVSASKVYLEAIEITSIMVLPAYLFTPIYLLSQLIKKKFVFTNVRQKLFYWTSSVIAALFCLWMITYSNFNLHLLTFIFYILGYGVYLVARRENKKPDEPYLKKGEWILAIVMFAISIYALVLLLDGKIDF